MKKRVLLGVDSGATKTEAALTALDGTVLARVVGGPAVLGARASGKAVKNLSDLIDRACAQARVSRGAIAFAGLGICGVDYDDELAAQRRSLLIPLGIEGERARLVNDGIAALWGGTPRERAVALQIGTGYTAAWRGRYGQETPFDPFNCGVVINLRREVYVTAYRVLDGRAPKSILPGLLMDYFGEHHLQTLIKKLRRGRFDREKVMNILAVLGEAVDRGDRVSLGIVRRAAGEYARDIGIMLGKIGGGPANVALGGGVLLNRPKMLLEMIRDKVREKHPRARVRAPLLSPAIGGCVMAAHLAGLDPKAVFNKAVQTQAQNPAAPQVGHRV